MFIKPPDHYKQFQAATALATAEQPRRSGSRNEEQGRSHSRKCGRHRETQEGKAVIIPTKRIEKRQAERRPQRLQQVLFTPRQNQHHSDMPPACSGVKKPSFCQFSLCAHGARLPVLILRISKLTLPLIQLVVAGSSSCKYKPFINPLWKPHHGGFCCSIRCSHCCRPCCWRFSLSKKKTGTGKYGHATPPLSRSMHCRLYSMHGYLPLAAHDTSKQQVVPSHRLCYLAPGGVPL